MKKHVITWISFLLMMLVGCSEDRNERLLASAEAYMETQTDSARWLLQQTDSVMTDEQRARYALLWTQAMHKCHIPLGNDSLINVAVDYYAHSDDRHQLALSLLYKGLVHKQRGEVELATKAFVGSEQAFDGVEDNQYKALLFNHYGALLMNQGMYEGALKYYKETYRYELSGDSIHYLISTCSQIAKVFKVVDLPDSADAYYKRGMEYVEKCPGDRRVKLFLQNYAAFLIDRKQYDEAERLLRETEVQADSTYIYNVYSSFATLYYETEEYGKAKNYGERMLESTDSMMQCTGYLHLYRIHKRMGEMETAVRYHDLYRQYDSDITLRKKTVQVAEIPHKMKARRLEEENRTAHRWQWTWGIGAVVVLGVAVWTVRGLRKRHGRQMTEKNLQIDEKDLLLTEKQTLLQEIEDKLYDLKIELGRVKGALANQSKNMANLKEDRKKDREAYNESVRELKRTLKEKDKEYRNGQRAVQAQVRELTNRLNQSEKEQMRWNNELKGLTEQMGLYELLQRFLLDGGNIQVVMLMLELKSGTHNRRYTIRRADYAVLLKQLADYAYPGLRRHIETDDELKNKQELASLLALGIDDMEMLRTATNLQPNSVRAYRTQVKKALDSFLQKEHREQTPSRRMPHE